MEHKKLIFFVVSLLVILLSVTMVSAEQNMTDIISIEENTADENIMVQENHDKSSYFR